MTTDQFSIVRAVAEDLFAARRDGRPIPPVRTRLPAKDLDAAYAVQSLNNAKRLESGDPCVGRKIGLTSEAVQRQLGVDQPDFGALFGSMDLSGESTIISVASLISPRIEAEFVFRMGADVTEAGIPPDVLAQAVDGVAVAAEIVDSAIAAWDIDIVDTIADNASCGAYVVGPWHTYTRDLDLPARTMRMVRRGDVVSSGKGSATLGDPLNALAWLADMAIRVGDPLRAGEVVLAGALGPMTPLLPGVYLIEIDGFAPLAVEAAA